MENTWDYRKSDNFDQILRFGWNCTLVSKLNETKGSLINSNDEISASYIFRDLLESLIYNEKPQISGFGN